MNDEKLNTDIAGTKPYDAVFLTLVTEHRDLVLKLINEMFKNTHYVGDEMVENLNGSYMINNADASQDKRITDSVISVSSHDGIRRIFHLECQSTADGTMVIRMFEYDTQIALKANSSFDGANLTVNMPESGVLYLRSNDETPDEMQIRINAPNGKYVDYSIPVLKLKNYGCDEIISKELYFLIPFYLFNFEDSFDKIEKGEKGVIDEFHKKYSEVYDKLQEKLLNGEITSITHHSIIMMTLRVIAALTKGKENLQREANSIMVGQVLEYETKDILNQGRKEGKEEGIAEGRAEGKAEGKTETQTQINKLNEILIEAGRLEDLKRSTKDTKFQEQLIKELVTK